MSKLTLHPEPLTAEAFAPYGDVIETATAAEERIINFGNTIRFHDMAKLELAKDNGTPLVSIFRSTPLDRPIVVETMERHPLSSQAFYPLSNRSYMVVVAGTGEFDLKNLRAFIAGPHQGVNYAPGVWHHYSLALNEVSDFLVIDRGGPEKNCDEVFFKETPVVIEY